MRKVWAGSINQNQISGGLNLYLFIFRRLIFESSVRDGTPSFAAAPAVPEIRPLLSASAASIICLSCFTSTPVSGSGRANLGGVSLFSQLSSTENVSPSHRITARSITFCNSRTFPGQLYPSNNLRDFLSMVVNFFPAIFPKRSMKYSTSKGMSASRSLNGGISIGTTVSRYKRSSRNLPSATSVFRSRWVAASALTSTGIGSLLPTRSISRSCRTRNSAI